MKKIISLALISMMTLSACAGSNPEAEVGGTTANTNDGTGSKVYFTKEITPESLVSIYEALGVSAEGKRVAVKISTGESSRTNYLRPEFIKSLVQKLDANIVECNTAYGGSRGSTAAHRRVIAERGFNDIATVDIMDEEGEMNLAVTDTRHIKYDIVGSHLQNYDLMVNLAHFKGHAMGGFGGVLKNQSIGMASSSGKLYIHSAGRSTTRWMSDDQDGFLESMAAAAQAVHNYFKQEGRDIVYINVMNNLSVDCDCDGSPATPQLKDIGILASTDPVALDKACLDLVFSHQSVAGDDASPLIRRIENLHGTHTVEYAEQLGLGSQHYTLIDLEGQMSAINGAKQEAAARYNVYSLDGKRLLTNASSLEGLQKGTYIVNGEKRVIE